MLKVNLPASVPVRLKPDPVTALNVPAVAEAKVAVAPVVEHATLSDPTVPISEQPVIVAVVLPSYGLLAAVKAMVSGAGPVGANACAAPLSDAL